MAEKLAKKYFFENFFRRGRRFFKDVENCSKTAQNTKCSIKKAVLVANADKMCENFVKYLSNFGEKKRSFYSIFCMLFYYILNFFEEKC